MTPPYHSKYDKLGRVSRRGFMLAITGSALAVVAGCRPEGVVPPTPYQPGSTRRLDPTEAATQEASGTAVADATYGQVTYDKPIITSADDLYITQYNYSKTPEVDISTWTLKVDGLVENPMDFDYATIKAFPAVEDTRTLECIGNPVGGDLIGNIVWKGFLFEEILKQVKVKPEATHVKFECADGYSTSVELQWITQPNVLLAYDMNGEPLNTRHGFPLRILTPGLYGQKMPRWITHMEFIDNYYKGYWESRGWSDVASVQTNSIIQTPNNGYTTQANNSLVIQGVAWAGKRKITSVEVQIDNGEWMPATLTQGGPTPMSWTQWYVTWTPPAPGNYQIGVRATDETGFVQINEANGIFGDSAPNGTSAIHRTSVNVS